VRARRVHSRHAGHGALGGRGRVCLDHTGLNPAKKPHGANHEGCFTRVGGTQKAHHHRPGGAAPDASGDGCPRDVEHVGAGEDAHRFAALDRHDGLTPREECVEQEIDVGVGGGLVNAVGPQKHQRPLGRTHPEAG
jgi:hypothetical protein